MKKSERLKPVKKLAEDREKNAAQNMAESAQTLQAGLYQLEKLARYREEYIAQFKAKGEQGVPAARLIEYQAFVQKIDQAIEHQRQRVETARLDMGQKQQTYQSTYNRKKAVEKVIDQSRAQEHKSGEKREQNEFDDRAQRGGMFNAAHTKLD